MMQQQFNSEQSLFHGFIVTDFTEWGTTTAEIKFFSDNQRFPFLFSFLGMTK